MKHLTILAAMLLLASCSSNNNKQEETTGVPADVVQRHLDLGIGYLRQRDYQRAKDKLNRALDIDPKNAAVHATFGLLFQLEGEVKLAEKYFQSAIRYDPDAAQARNSYGAFLFSQGRYHQAIEQLTKAADNRFYPNRATVFENLGVAYIRVADMENADYSFTRAVQLNPEQPRALIELALIRFNQKNYVEARELYNRHTRVSQKNPRTLLLCIKLAHIFKDEDEEASCVVALEGIYPNSPEYREYRESL